MTGENPTRRDANGNGKRVRRSSAARPSSLIIAFLIAALVPLVYAFEGGDQIGRQTLAVLAALAVAVAIAFGLLPRTRVSGRAIAIPALLLALLAWTALSLAWTESAMRTMGEVARLSGYLVVVGIAALALSRRTWRAAAMGLVAAVTALVVLALLARLFPDLFSDAAGELGLGLRRLSYPIGYWNGVATLGAVAAGLAIVWFDSPPLRRLRTPALALYPVAVLVVYLTYSRAGVGLLAIASLLAVALARDTRLAASAALAAALAAVPAVLVARGQEEIATGSGGDGGWLVVGALVLAAILLHQLAPYLLRSRRSARLPVARGRAVSALAVIALTGLAIGAGATEEAGAPDPAATFGAPIPTSDPAARLARLDGQRGELWNEAFDAFTSEPLTGIGAGSYELWFRRERPDSFIVRDAHSLPIEALGELGPVGLVLALMLLGGGVLLTFQAFERARGRVDRAAAGSTVVIGLVIALHGAVDWIWELAPLMVIGLGAFAIAAASGARPVVPRRRLGRTAVALIAGAVALGIVQVPGLVREERLEAAGRALDVGDPEAAIERADEAITAEPWAARPYAVRAGVELELDRLDEARSDALSAIDREPTDPRHLVLLARIERAAGNQRAAGAALELAQELVDGDDAGSE